MFPGSKRNPGNARGTDRNRRVSGPLSPIFYLFLAPSGKLYQKLHYLLAEDEKAQRSTPSIIQHRRSVYDFPPSSPGFPSSSPGRSRRLLKGLETRDTMRGKRSHDDGKPYTGLRYCIIGGVLL